VHLVLLTHDTSWMWLSSRPRFGLATIRHAADALTELPGTAAFALAWSEPGAAVPDPTGAVSVAAMSRGVAAEGAAAPTGPTGPAASASTASKEMVSKILRVTTGRLPRAGPTEPVASDNCPQPSPGISQSDHATVLTEPARREGR
jgi:hypothetical protein